MMIKVGIIGGAGYTAGELIRILLRHPIARIEWVHSSSNAGNEVSEVHTDLVGECDLKFTNQMDFGRVDVIFLCMGHGKSETFMNSHQLPANLKVIDLSNDFRLNRVNNDFVYGLPEYNKPKIRGCRYLANPGCFATAIQLALLPLAVSHLLNEIHVHAITGSTGAGQAPSPTTHFSWRNGNVSVYKAFGHQHLNEIVETMTDLMPEFDKPFNFVPMRGNFSRGILASVYMDCQLQESEAVELFDKFYATHPFVTISRRPVDVKQVVNTNKCLLHIKKYGGKLHIVSVIDNLTKGASGQAVQNMNLMFGLEEPEGLNLKPVAF
ncbi:N-acetyl-gamma-glutamyl-phosphate reductase [Thermophagus xiamenensis]|jgi:N-acetyl-gamma-glutamyl-phosphate reductase|uniref:N-acetyl-gamma-glutamyl-phosphate reductase n=2 Tax=Thermophagus xiamenensis TaxID=385682 RepID=A0A1I1UID4_9BACT|nr:N-acetyl-gamma-glutamyl-phosphate reductase [Thermophagus xiamenensis]SFD70529.1 N-acetyl-gamma-glutamyl-phosphate reductase [Thermophagus xiamenensis]